jgi:uncharacterized protein
MSDPVQLANLWLAEHMRATTESMMQNLKPPPRDAVTKRLKRASGHLGAVVSLVEKQRSSLQVAQQLAAVEAALAAARQQVVQEQLRVCLDGGDVEGSTLRQLRAIARFL